ncbi:glycosyltransferase family 10 domain-containing protein [Engelhardtia mirabilis]|uniref:Glycosyltransferase family 10 (Fucosyltransferase) n=1 Tax=Engelhardtia mirabilis TaxID=2528011 RepID=A0A518BJW3_9BACT|nr:Glycosyltransferase family 10 (fucosyltransferase) [Planctomycetes bacterium Pla133]QDV01593.1 Glycosyltransferase family 10 (fucosyltransferase) [Planctomycetes bacterium Pla86]
MRTIRVAFRDFWAGFEPDHFFQRHPEVLRHWRYELSDRPDLVIYSSFPGGEKLMTQHAIDDDAVRLYYTAENVAPDLSRCDFAIGFDRDLTDPRFLRLPNYVGTQSQIGFMPDALVGRADRDLEAAMALKQGACIFVQGNHVPWREAFVKKLSEAMRVDCAGPVLNNTGFTISRKDKYGLYRRYKFAITFENERSRGYVTEKINDALLTDVVPIYAGDPTVAEDFDPGCFLNLDSFPDEDALIEEILRLNEDDEAYAQMLRAPAYAQDRMSPWVDPERQLEFFDRVMGAAARGQRWSWMGSRPDGAPVGDSLQLALGPRVHLEPDEFHVSSDPLDQPDVVADEVALVPLAEGSIDRLRVPGLVLQWSPDEAVAALSRWREKIAPGGRLELAVGDWDVCRKLADWAPREAFSTLFAHGSRRAPRWGWTADELNAALAGAGFEHRDVRPFGRHLRARAAGRPGCLVDPPTAVDLVIAWPRFDQRELVPTLAAFAACSTEGLRLALRYDPALDGPLEACVDRLELALRSIRTAAAIDLVVLSDPIDDLCPFDLGARTAAVMAGPETHSDRMRFLTALGHAVVGPDELSERLDGRVNRRAG